MLFTWEQSVSMLNIELFLTSLYFQQALIHLVLIPLLQKEKIAKVIHELTIKVGIKAVFSYWKIYSLALKHKY